MSEDFTKMRPEELHKAILEFFTPEPRARAMLDEMERRLKEVDDCICWGVDCVHQAKELDKSYEEYREREQLREVLLEALDALDQWEAGPAGRIPPSGWWHIVDKGRTLLAKGGNDGRTQKAQRRG